MLVVGLVGELISQGPDFGLLVLGLVRAHDLVVGLVGALILQGRCFGLLAISEETVGLDQKREIESVENDCSQEC